MNIKRLQKQILWALCCLFLALSGSGNLYAQETKNEKATGEKPEIPEEYLAEMFDFHAQCKIDPVMYEYHDCDCLAVKYLDTRMEMGPYRDKTSIILAISDQCPDATGAAGRFYEECMTNSPLMPLDIPEEEFCSCYGNTYAKLFEQYKTSISSVVSIQIQEEAHMRCARPDLAAKLYPKRPNLDN